MKVCGVCFHHHIEEECPHCSDVSKTGVMKTLGVLLGVGLTACVPLSSKYGAPMVDMMDFDEDGFHENEDCDDTDPNTYPGAAIEDSETACMTDADGDGYGDANLDEGSNAEAGTDCDDSDPDVNPGNENCETE